MHKETIKDRLFPLRISYPVTAALQDIRNRVVDGTITTFTWYPTRGLASKTDPMGITTYYEYDGYGRLLTIRDNNKHITDSFEYNKKQ